MFDGVPGEDLDRAWAAGVFDGEGTTSQQIGYLQVRVPQAGDCIAPPGVIRRFWEAMGGVGSIGGPYDPVPPGKLPQWTYTASGARACTVLAAMWPWLGEVKRRQAQMALQACRPSQFGAFGQSLVAADLELSVGSVPLTFGRIDRRRRGGPSGARLGEIPNATELAWAAGFFDGEGSTFNLQARRYPKISISQNGPIERPPDVLVRFRQAVLEIGDLDGPIHDQGRIKWHYFVDGHDLVQAVIALIWPWLGEVKRVQAVAALREYREQGRPLRRPGQRRGRPLNRICKRGHDYSDVVVNHEGRRQCRPCRNLLARESMRRVRARKRAARQARS